MSNRERCNALLDGFTDAQLVNVAAVLQAMKQTITDAAADEAPNAETLEAMEEVRRMKEDPGLGKTYTDVDAMMKELLA